MKRIFWIDVLRGLAVIAVVICHQQGLLHTSEYVQFFTLFSVTSLIFAMGITKGFSLKKYFETGNDNTIFMYTLKSMGKTLLAYVTASFFTDILINKVYDYPSILDHIINFNASGPFYFIGHFIKLSLWAPVIYFAFCKIMQNSKRTHKIVLSVLTLLATWIIGYKSINVCDIFSQSYFFVYSLGILVSMIELPKSSVKLAVGSVLLLATGTFFAHRFYFARVAGNFCYAELIDVVDPMLQLNPPNLSVILYSFGVISVIYIISTCAENVKSLNIPFKLLSVLGKYSLDIFLWHLFIQRMITTYALGYLSNIWVRRLVYYLAMFNVPILARYLYNKLKKKMYELKKSQPAA